MFCVENDQFGSALPTWVPESARHYLAHTETGLPIRALARDAGCHASTVLRQVRKLESRRDDPLVDAALRRLGQRHFQPADCQPEQKDNAMTLSVFPEQTQINDATLASEGRRVLRRLCETGAVLAVAAEMDKAVVVRDTGEGGATRTAVVEANVAQALALKEWIHCDEPGRISRYRITAAGRAALGKLLAERESRVRGFAEAQAGFDTGRDADAALEALDLDPRGHKSRFALSDSPLAALARRRDKDGKPFIAPELVSAGERLREDFELSQLGPKVTQNWDQFLTAGVQSNGRGDDGRQPGAEAARLRVQAALKDLGPGLADVALRCCCYLEGLETAEKRMGWSARSGKIVLRIALQRLQRHFTETSGAGGRMIG
ncbi:DUF6456 domain-containing protein [Puniceibacterium sp. IMCC21224]|uniref:DUF6456 domain-containing protein n=1 Tax=Puniceibacterium sp. IMCC21224 TaxID=1618204 RepID=UPI00064D7668|nr:DUF6456 domain-containing protein [Puniceibacterium sp. IMCC21224]KMK66892.1 hypothetical protein IMCC21224_111751 [Puniceibacterium sp. IMCC21224]